jgi:hypothetical protein
MKTKKRKPLAVDPKIARPAGAPNVFLNVSEVHLAINVLEGRRDTLNGLHGFKRSTSKLQKLIDKLYHVTWA